jgi:carbon storage regulator
MLVLSRQPGEKVVIDGDITITLVQVNGGQVKIGIEAPADVVILRGELVARRKASLAACLVADQVGADHGRSGFRPEPITAAGIKDQLRRLRKAPR